MSFYTDVIQKDPRFHSTVAVNDLSLLEPSFRAAIVALVTDALLTAAGAVHLRPLETYRSAELQEIYYKRGATQLQHVGVHHYGLACDLGIVLGGQVNWKTDYSLLGHLAAKHGLVWGGDWGTPGQPHSFRDYDHLQRIAVADQPRLFSGTWYPDALYRPAQVG
jgi:D-alanyl-D-alanine carboxypeptidase-like protein